jgi:hypothetical protein
MKIRLLLIQMVLISLPLLLNSCKKEEDEPVQNTAPTISIASLSTDSVKEFVDSVIVEISYQDAQGNLGSIDPDVNDLEVKDSRLSQPDFYHVKPLAPEGYTLNISGKLRIRLSTLFLLGIGDQETATFTIRLRDQSGEWSAPVTSDPIKIVR